MIRMQLVNPIRLASIIEALIGYAINEIGTLKHHKAKHFLLPVFYPQKCVYQKLHANQIDGWYFFVTKKEMI